MPKGEGRSISLWVSPGNESVIRAAYDFMDDMGMSFASLVSSALEEYIENHKPVPGVLPVQYKEHRVPKNPYICSNVIRPGTPRSRNCERPAGWQFWDASKPPLDTLYYSCSHCLSTQLNSDDADAYTVQRIEY